MCISRTNYVSKNTAVDYPTSDPHLAPSLDLLAVASFMFPMQLLHKQDEMPCVCLPGRGRGSKDTVSVIADLPGGVVYHTGMSFTDRRPPLFCFPGTACLTACCCLSARDEDATSIVAGPRLLCYDMLVPSRTARSSPRRRCISRSSISGSSRGNSRNQLHRGPHSGEAGQAPCGSAVRVPLSLGAAGEAPLPGSRGLARGRPGRGQFGEHAGRGGGKALPLRGGLPAGGWGAR